MVHSSIKLDSPVEFVNVQPINPLISKCQIKVCYVGDTPNRNGSVITKDVARNMANSLPGCPIVGFFNEGKSDYEEHNRVIDISDGKFEIKDTTKPYGFVDLNARVWFQKFLDDGMNEHEYLMTEGYLWTSQYPECQRVIDRGNNQSMELDEKTLNASWSKDENENPEFFIINEAIISKLCILGEDNEPCFEGSTITKVQFSFDDGFKNELYSMMKELKDLLNEGGAKMTEEEVVISQEDEKETVFSASEAESSENTDFKKKEEEKKENSEDKSDKEEESENEDKTEEEKSSDEEKSSEDEDAEKKNDSESGEENEDKKKKYSLEEIPEYVELLNNYSELENKFNALVSEKEALEAKLAPLAEFKANSEKKEKQAMIDSFYMLSEEDKKDVITNIDTYSVDDIEAKLSVICVRNKISWNDSNEESNSATVTYSLNNDEADASTPAWVKACLQYKKD